MSARCKAFWTNVRSYRIRLSGLRCISCALLLEVVSCEATPEYCAELETDRIEQKLVNGSSSGDFLAISPERKNAIGRVWPFDAPPGAFCTGILVGSKWVLTAKHCDSKSGFAFEIGSEFDNNPTIAYSVDALRSSELDALLIELGEDLPQEPIDLIREDIDQSWVSVPVQLAGYGITEKGKPSDDLLFLVGSVVEVNQTDIVVSVAGRSGACLGDSGGPILTRDASGNLVVAGILTTGTVNCRSRDRYLRADTLRQWVAASVGENRSISEPCYRLTEMGFCRRNIAIWCGGGSIVAEQCTGGLRCGYSASSFGFRCVGPDEDACDGIDDIGVCEKGRSTRCVLGTLIDEDCEGCGLTCGLEPTIGTMSCMKQL